jgi:hypothetical protein
MAEQREPMVFLSYSSKDTEQVIPIRDRLEASGFRTWMHSKDVRPGEKWAESIEDAIESADYFLVFLTKDYVKSEHMYIELKMALNQAKQRKGIYLIPVRLEDVETPSELMNYQWVDFLDEDALSQLVEALGGSRAYSLPQPQVPQELVDACRSGECVLYAGAGVGAEAGFPTWKPFVNSLVQWAVSKKYVDMSYAQSLTAATAQQEQLDSVADSVVNIVKEHKANKDLNDFLRKTFIDPKIETPEIHRVLRTIPFSAALTTNFDVLLEKIFSHREPRIFTPQDTEALLTAFSKRDFFVLRLYGDVDRPETLLLSQSEFEDTIRQNYAFNQFMESLFFNRTILFLGASIAGIETYLRGIRFKSGMKTHYALVEVRDETYKVEASRLARRYGIQVIPFTTQANYTEVLEFVDDLAEEIQPDQKEHIKGETGSKRAAGGQGSFLNRVTLENIGPFDSLLLELDQDWNILLGDNGVGKSSILKAIALGIAGEDAQLYADRLIKSGQTHATIALETNNGKPYVTEILKTTSGPAQVISRGGRLLEGEGWLTLGFPPLRSMGWEQLRGPQLEEGKRRPIPDDVLPLVMGEPDPRCNRLKQWILNLDYRSAKVAGKSDKESARFQNMMDQFFEVVGRLVEGVKVEFRQVDADRGRILILTEDGEVPIEAMSQGTISLIGWVGVLLQRMYEVFEDVDNVREQYALVLIDEIDAHMHPGWQQKLVRHLKELFPKVQFIATTHSPLVTLTSEPGETLLVQRAGPERNQIVVQRSDLDVRRWRADQVLTTLFGLESSNPMLHAWIQEYTDLLARDSLNPQEEGRLQYLASMLEIAPPEPFEREEARLAYQSIQKALDEQFASIPEEKLEEIRKEAKVQVMESLSRQRRPL